MFWFEDELCQKLCRFAKNSFCNQRGTINEMKTKFPDFPDGFSFNKMDYIYIKNREIDYIQALVSTSLAQKLLIKNLNKLLDDYSLGYENGNILNRRGSSAVVSIEYILDKYFVRKTFLDEHCGKYYSQEKSICEEIAKNENVKDRFLLFENYTNNSLIFPLAKDTLFSYVRSNELSLPNKKRIIVQICSAIDLLYKIGILHRDLHPDNIFLFNDNIIKIGDFGISIKIDDLAHERESSPRVSYGAPLYRAPELESNLSKASIITELYSLGRLINFIITGSPKNYNHELREVANRSANKNPEMRVKSIDRIIRLIQM